ncbi:hypothetical protein OKW21_003930 [Catalinimonas alkaloidigena]|uniref:hypothetical protein n=1 Tax=Catalinimonas alkaloidigena TaxID=1075417 RepID=UPI002405D79B|nr:hypothetical protein [Catalinimonas alkaloidigena]MDF9798667.1 hypothetical protein [Catalinimonas alkaloidigena]
MKYRKKPVTIDAIQWNETDTQYKGVKAWCESFGDRFEDHFITDDGFKVNTLEGSSYSISPGDYIIRGVKGEYYPCKADIFAETYEAI